mmetsp:Transcript_43099/g.133177  ORF Transcript_43099/g.133177 Transcript_43099/m.133177 type:complete len:230 (-) Transcript_43099:538-1227(-)
MTSMPMSSICVVSSAMCFDAISLFIRCARSASSLGFCCAAGAHSAPSTATAATTGRPEAPDTGPAPMLVPATMRAMVARTSWLTLVRIWSMLEAQLLTARTGSTMRHCDMATMSTSTLSLDSRSLPSSRSVCTTVGRKHASRHLAFSRKYVRFGASTCDGSRLSPMFSTCSSYPSTMSSPLLKVTATSPRGTVTSVYGPSCTIWSVTEVTVWNCTRGDVHWYVPGARSL